MTCFFGFVVIQALEKSKYEQSLETVRHFIQISEKELQLYYNHIALYGDLVAAPKVEKSKETNPSMDNPDLESDSSNDESNKEDFDSADIQEFDCEMAQTGDEFVGTDDEELELNSKIQELINGEEQDLFNANANMPYN